MKRCKLGDIAEFKTGPFGTQFKANEYTQTGVPVINVKNIGNGLIIEDELEYISDKTKQRLSSHIIHHGDIVFARKGSVERHAYIDKKYDGWVQGSDCIKATISSEYNSEYISYYLYLESVKQQLLTHAVGSTMPSMNTDILSDIDIFYPTDATKVDEVVSLLRNIKNKIALNNRLNATLEAMAKTLYDYWFVQFDFPDEKGRPYKTSGGKMVYNEELGREIPAGWEVVPLQAIAHVVQGNSPEGDTLNETGDGMVFYQGKADFGFRFPDVRTYTTSPYRIAEKYDTLLSVRAPVGSVNMAREKCCIGRGLAAIRCDFPSFMYYTLMKIQPHLEKYSSIGTTFNAITKDDIMAFTILQPHRSQISHFEKIVSNYDKDIMCRTEENRRLAALRDWLLPMLMNGQVGFKVKCDIYEFI